VSTDDLRSRLATERGLSGDQAAEFAARLNGETAEELTADAVRLHDALRSLFPKTYGPPPAVDPSQGSSSAPSDDPAARFRQRMDEMATSPIRRGSAWETI
jgi:hypothetical protein